MTAILGCGGYAPERVMTSEDWSALVDTDDEWITTRTGVKRRHFAADDESTLDVAYLAAAAIADATPGPAELDEVIVATDTPEVYTPDTASLLQDRLGLRTVPTYDLGGSGCAGWVQALDVARARIAFQTKRVLVVA